MHHTPSTFSILTLLLYHTPHTHTHTLTHSHPHILTPPHTHQVVHLWGVVSWRREYCGRGHPAPPWPASHCLCPTTWWKFPHRSQSQSHPPLTVRVGGEGTSGGGGREVRGGEKGRGKKRGENRIEWEERREKRENKEKHLYPLLQHCCCLTHTHSSHTKTLTTHTHTCHTHLHTPTTHTHTCHIHLHTPTTHTHYTPTFTSRCWRSSFSSLRECLASPVRTSTGPFSSWLLTAR